MAYRLDVSMTVEIADASAATRVAGVSGGSTEVQIQAAAQAGLAELESVARRYGFSISDASAQVTTA